MKAEQLEECVDDRRRSLVWGGAGFTRAVFEGRRSPMQITVDPLVAGLAADSEVVAQFGEG